MGSALTRMSAGTSYPFFEPKLSKVSAVLSGDPGDECLSSALFRHSFPRSFATGVKASPLRCTNRRDEHGGKTRLALFVRRNGRVRRTASAKSEDDALRRRDLDLLRQPIVFMAFSAEECARDVDLLFDSPRSENVQVRRFVVAVEEVTDFHHPFLHERLEAVVRLADAHAQGVGHLPFRGCGMLL